MHPDSYLHNTWLYGSTVVVALSMTLSLKAFELSDDRVWTFMVDGRVNASIDILI